MPNAPKLKSDKMPSVDPNDTRKDQRKGTLLPLMMGRKKAQRIQENFLHHKLTRFQQMPWFLGRKGDLETPQITQSGKAFSMSTGPRSLWQRLVAAIVPMALFMGSSHGFIFQSNGMNKFAPHLHNKMAPEVTIDECIGLKASVNSAMLDYVTQCDDWIEGIYERWTPIVVKAHAISRSKQFDPNKKEFTQGGHLCLKTELAD